MHIHIHAYIHRCHIVCAAMCVCAYTHIRLCIALCVCTYTHIHRCHTVCILLYTRTSSTVRSTVHSQNQPLWRLYIANVLAHCLLRNSEILKFRRRRRSGKLQVQPLWAAEKGAQVLADAAGYPLTARRASLATSSGGCSSHCATYFLASD